MSLARAFDLRFLTPVRIGVDARDRADMAPDFPSDTLSAALVVAAADLGADQILDQSLEEVAERPPWVVSSLLPWVELEGRTVRFLPFPLDRSFGSAQGASPDRKVAYVASSLVDPKGPPSPEPPFVSSCGSLIAATSSIRRVRWQRRSPRSSLTVDRVTGAAERFHLGETARGIARGTGVWVAVRTEAEATMKLVRALLEHLAESGLGAGRARGLGRFVIEREEPLSLDETSDPARMRLLLGVASPDEALEEALADGRARYSVIRRDGKAHGASGGLGLRRKTLRLLGPGSVVPDRGAVVGRTRDVTPRGFTEHAIYRDGRTLAWPIAEAFA